MTGTEILETVLQQARSVPAESLPQFLGQLETIRVTALQRLQAPAPQPAKQTDRLLSVNETAAMLGCGRSILYHGRLGLTPKRVGRKVMFSEAEIQKFISSKRG